MARIETGYRDFTEDGFIDIHVHDASPQAVKIVTSAPEDDKHNGRSQWVWLRFGNGDLALATFPQGDTYFDVEEEASIGMTYPLKGTP